MGVPLESQKAFRPTGAEVNDFFPHAVTINAGDSVKFVATSFHNVDLPAKGKKPISFLVGTPPISGATDAAAAPFWFNGRPSFQFNPAVVVSNFGKKLTYTGAKAVQSGLPLGAKPKPMTVKFTKAGSYGYYCDVHSGMKGIVRVLAAGKTIPTAKQDQAALAAQVARDLKTAKALSKAGVAANTVDIGEAGPYGVEYYDFLPDTLTVPKGTTVKFQMSPKSYDDHTATTGPGDPDKEASSYLGVIAQSFTSPAPLDGRGVYASDTGLASLTPALHGNGFWNSGILDTVGASPLPASNSVTFAAAGTYQFYCLIHPFMHGTVVVT
jgi:plastocyanin